MGASFIGTGLVGFIIFFVLYRKERKKAMISARLYEMAEQGYRTYPVRTGMGNVVQRRIPDLTYNQVAKAFSSYKASRVMAILFFAMLALGLVL